MVLTFQKWSFNWSSVPPSTVYCAK